MTGKPASSAPHEADVKRIANWVKHQCECNGKKIKPCVTFLLGAGFSRSAGIPLAGEIVEDKLKPHFLLEGTPEPGPDDNAYAHYMRELNTPSDRAQVIRECIDEAVDPNTNRTKINWAHLLLASMVNAGYVKYILTTNFDPLTVDALSLIGYPVRVFDLTASEFYLAGTMAPGSIIYLHGQASGPVIANTVSETENVRTHLRIVFQDALSDSTLIVIGYSGASDPVLQELDGGFPHNFPNALYWVAYEDHLPHNDAMNLLSNTRRGASLVRGHNADSFMRELVLEHLKVDLPPMVLSPCGYAKDALARVLPFPEKDEGPESIDPVEAAQAEIERAIECLSEGAAPVQESPDEPSSSNLSMKIAMASLKGDRQALDAIRAEFNDQTSDALCNQLSGAYRQTAIKAYQDQQFVEAYQLLEEAESLGSDEPEWLLVTWGKALSDQAGIKVGDESDALFETAYAKYAEAVRIKPDMHEAWYNWGVALSDRAQASDDERAAALFESAYEKYAESVRIKPDKHEAWSNWGGALIHQFHMNQGPHADAIIQSAQEKIEESYRIKPDYASALFNLACISALKANTGDTVAWLEQWRELESNACRHELDDESDFDRVREDPAFVAFYESLPE